MDVQAAQLNLFTAPYLKESTATAWQQFREDYYAYRARGGTVPIRRLINRTVMELYVLRDPQLLDELEERTTPPETRDVAMQDEEHSSDSDSDSSDSDSNDEQAQFTLETLDTASETFINRVNVLFQPIDRREALDKFERLYCATKGSTSENVLRYVYHYQRQLENVGTVRPSVKQLVKTFVANIEPERLRDRVGTYADRTSLNNTFRAAIEQSRYIEQVERERERLKTKKSGDEPQTTRQGKWCKNCRSNTHNTADCRRTKGNKTPKYLLFTMSSANDKSRPVFRVTFDSKEIDALFDTGATANFVDERYVLRRDIVESKTDVVLASGQKISSPGHVDREV